MMVRNTRGWALAVGGRACVRWRVVWRAARGPHREPGTRWWSAPAPSPRSSRTWIGRWRSITTCSTWRFRPMPASGVAPLQQPERPAVRVLRHHGREGAASVGAGQGHPHRRRGRWRSSRSAPRRSPCASRIPATPRSCWWCATSTPRWRRSRPAKYPVVTPGGKPVELGDGTRAVLIRDVDDRFIEIRQPAFDSRRRARHNIVDIRAEISVPTWSGRTRSTGTSSSSRSRASRRSRADKAQRALTGLGKAEVRRSSAKARDSAAVVRVRRVQGRGPHAAEDADPGPRRDADPVQHAEHRRDDGQRQGGRPQHRDDRRRCRSRFRRT